MDEIPSPENHGQSLEELHSQLAALIDGLRIFFRAHVEVSSKVLEEETFDQWMDRFDVLDGEINEMTDSNRDEIESSIRQRIEHWEKEIPSIFR